MKFKAELGPFRDKLSEDIFIRKYRHEGAKTWDDLAETLTIDVCNNRMTKDDMWQVCSYIKDMKFIPGGRYLYYAGRPKKFFNNCYLLRAEEDSRKGWADLSWKSEMCLMTGGGIGIDFSRIREEGAPIRQTGGVASGPIAKMKMINEIGRNVMQGGSRRSAMYGSINWKHPDAHQFLTVKDWANQKVQGTPYTVAQMKELDFNYSAPLDMMNISLNYDTAWLEEYKRTGDPGQLFKDHALAAMRNGEPGFSFNFYDKEEETLRNACTEVSSKDDSDVCNLGSINLSRIDTIDELRDVVHLATEFLLCGTFVADLPYEKVYEVREKNRRLGLGLMGIHEWLLKKGYRYEVTQELKEWLEVYEKESDDVARSFADVLGCQRPVAARAIAPTGTIGMLASTTTGIEPILQVAYKRRYIVDGNKYKYQLAVDHTANALIEQGINPDKIETSEDLANDYERRISFQAEVQSFVDQSISSTINLPGFNPDSVDKFAATVAKYADRLRGLTVYPDGARGGQPITKVDFYEAKEKLGQEFDDNIEANDSCIGGVCGI